jgi:diacylglycerol O-acyltransferase / wax synthase
VRRLAGADSQFLFGENRVRHQHTLKIAIIDPSGAQQPATYDALRAQVREALPLIEPFHWKLVHVPGNLGQPYWFDTADLDVDYHVRRAAVPSPGGPRELAETISEIASTSLERDRPLWQVWFVEGLANGHIAYVAKVHHALADGVASARLLLQAFTESPDITVIPPPDALQSEPEPSRMRLFLRGLGDTARLLAHLPSLLVGTARQGWRMRERRRQPGAQGAARPFSGPRTQFDRPLTPHRWLAFEPLPLAEIKRVKNATGCTVNDVFLALVSGALRRYLGAHGRLPRRPLTASVPVSTRTEEDALAWGNRLTTWYVELATDVDDPLERLQTIHRNTLAARDALEDIRDLQHEWVEFWPLFKAFVFGMPKLIAPFVGRRPSYNVIVSNVAGPPRPLYRHGARLVRLISMGPLVEGLGLNFTGWSYVDEMTIAVMGCREHLPDVWDLAEGLRASLDELLSLTDQSVQVTTGR